MVLVVASMVIGILGLFILLIFAGQKAGWIYTIIHFIGLFLVLGIYASYNTSSIRMTWIVLIMAVPIFGTMMYLFVGMDRSSFKMRRRFEDIDNILFPILPKGVEEANNVNAKDKRLGGIVDYIRLQAGYPVYQNSYGINCRVFNPFAPGLNLFLNNRDHRKITVIDGKIGYTGGYNLANEYFHITEPYGFWKDTGIRLEGDAVQSLTVTFLEMWNALSHHHR